MENLKQAYETLGLPETATKEELENRYYLLVRRARAQKMREHGQPQAEGDVDIDAVSEAFRFIRDYEENQAKEQYTQNAYGKYRKMAGRAQKWDHFFHYYKIHMLVGIIMLIAIGYGIKSYSDHRAEQARLAKLPPANLSVMFYGNYFYGDAFGSDTEPLQADILKQFPDWQRVIAEMTYVPAEMKSEQDMALIQKSMIVMIDNKSDLFIVDKANFDKLATQGAFLPIDDLADVPDAKTLAESGEARKSKTEDDTSEHVYGIDLSGTAIGKELGVSGTSEFIAAVRVKAKNPGNAVAFMEHYLNEAK